MHLHMYQIILQLFNCRRDPSAIPWGANKVATVVESTGIFTTIDKALVQHINL